MGGFLKKSVLKRKPCDNHSWARDKGYANRRVCKKCGKVEVF